VIEHDIEIEKSSTMAALRQLHLRYLLEQKAVATQPDDQYQEAMLADVMVRWQEYQCIFEDGSWWNDGGINVVDVALLLLVVILRNNTQND
jgi:hypothetical protein